MAHNQLGLIYRDGSDPDRAVRHYREAVRYQERQGDVYSASGTRFNIAIALADAGPSQDALEFARAALRGFESFGESAADWIQRTRQLIGEIEQKL